MLNVTCPFNALGMPSHFPMENRHEAVVVSQELRMERQILRDGYQRPLPAKCNVAVEVAVIEILCFL